MIVRTTNDPAAFKALVSLFCWAIGFSGVRDVVGYAFD